MARRLKLQTLLESLTPNVYFQPPANVQMKYPCLVYKVDSGRTLFASNSPYRRTTRYQVTVIDQNPDSVIPDLVAAQPMCTFSTQFSANNLNHFVFNLYF